CGAGYHLVRDANNCCGYYCAPDDCANVACPATAYQCPAGYRLDTSYPDCCGKCVYDDQSRSCTSNNDCLAGEVCSTSSGACMPPPGCDPNSGCLGGPVCYGVCQSNCPAYAYPTTACAGYWQTPGRDQNGCPLPPECTCYDGTVSRHGACPNHCSMPMLPPVDCTSMACQSGYHCESGYPYCCGGCVADGSCLYTGSNKSTGAACASVTCQPGMHEALDANCCPTCRT